MNFWDYILIALVAAAVAAAIYFTVRNKKKGKCSCGCDSPYCEGCDKTKKDGK